VIISDPERSFPFIQTGASYSAHRADEWEDPMIARSVVAFAAAAMLSGAAATCSHSPPVHRAKKTTTTWLTCKSKDYQPNTCSVGGRISGIRLREQKSVAPCELERTYGFRGESIWVADGCAAEFEVRYKEY
jgi:hypothetical protein